MHGDFSVAADSFIGLLPQEVEGPDPHEPFALRIPCLPGLEKQQQPSSDLEKERI